MPDRDKVKVGDLVYVCFFNGGFTHHYGKVQQDEDGLLIQIEGDVVGYLKDADKVRKAVISKGNLCFCREFEEEDYKGCFLVSVPMNNDGSISWDCHPPEDCLPEPERIDPEDAKELREIAKKLGCQLY